MATIKNPKNPQTFNCNICDFISCNRKDYNRHMATLKHQKRLLSTNDNSFTTNTPNKFICNKCNKCYKERTGLWRHNQTCNPIQDTSNNFVIDKELVMTILKQNADIIKENSELKNLMMEEHKSTQQMMLEVIKTGTHNTTNNTNSHNKTFNLQFFLNETCKNAMNIMDFVDSLHL